jgi:hypothetical protein
MTFLSSHFSLKRLSLKNLTSVIESVLDVKIIRMGLIGNVRLGQDSMSTVGHQNTSLNMFKIRNKYVALFTSFFSLSVHNLLL